VAGKVTVGLAFHWPCITDSVGGLSTYGLDGHRNGAEHPACAPDGCGMLYLYLYDDCDDDV